MQARRACPCTHRSHRSAHPSSITPAPLHPSPMPSTNPAHAHPYQLSHLLLPPWQHPATAPFVNLDFTTDSSRCTIANLQTIHHFKVSHQFSIVNMALQTHNGSQSAPTCSRTLSLSHSNRFSSPAAAAAATPSAAAAALPAALRLLLLLLLLPRGGSRCCSAISAGSHQGARLQYFQRGAPGSQGSAMACRCRCSTELKGGCRKGGAGRKCLLVGQQW